VEGIKSWTWLEAAGRWIRIKARRGMCGHDGGDDGDTQRERERERVCDEATTARRGRLLGLLLLGPLVNEGDRATIHLAVRRRRRRRHCVLAVRTKHAAPC